MRLLLIDVQGCMVDYALRCIDAGHQVRYYFPRNDKNKLIGKGLVQIVNDWHEWARWADIIVLGDNTKYLRELDAWRARGTKVIGATVESAAWELNRTLGQQVFKKARIPVIPYREFSDYDQAIAYVKRENRRFVSKPCGDEPDKSLSYVSKDAADMIYMLQRWKKNGRMKSSFILQEFVGGVEMAVGAWIGPAGFNLGWCENFEFKALMAGDKGPNTGEMGTVVRYVRRSKLAELVLAPLEDAIVATGHTGYVDVNCIIDESGDPWPLEFTMRPGWPTFNIQQVLHQGDPAEWLACLSEGRSEPQPHLLPNKLAVGIVVAIPDFPYSHITRKDVVGVPIMGVTKRNRPFIHPCEVQAGTAPQEVAGKIVEMPCWTTAGDYVLVTTGVGETVRTARQAAYRVAESLKIPSSPFWRPDIGQRLKKQLPQIQAQGFATKLEF